MKIKVAPVLPYDLLHVRRNCKCQLPIRAVSTRRYGLRFMAKRMLVDLRATLEYFQLRDGDHELATPTSDFRHLSGNLLTKIPRKN
jgi:hypothetical protein